LKIANLGKTLRAHEEPKSLPPDTFPGLRRYQNCFGDSAALELTRPLSWIYGLTPFRGREGREGTREEERNGKGKEGGIEGHWESCIPLSGIQLLVPERIRLYISNSNNMPLSCSNFIFFVSLF